MMQFSITKVRRQFILFLVVMAVSLNVHAAAVDDFKQGLAAYRSGNYQQAVSYFEKARNAGLKKTAVFFNLGSSYYRLGQYDKAIPMFERVTRSPKMRDLGYFNLGLIARQQDNKSLAKTHFKKAIALSKNEKLIYLAQQNLDELDSPVGIWRGGAIAEIGYDDNVSNTALGLASGGDSYAALRAYSRVLVAGTRKKGWEVHGDFFNRAYSNFNNYSLGSFGLGINRNMSLFGQRGYVGAFYKTMTLGGSEYENIAGIDVSARSSRHNGVSYRYRYRAETIDAAPVYSYLQGTRQRLDVERRLRTEKRNQLRLVYRLEVNDRQDDPGVASYTNVRHGVRAIYNPRAENNTRWRYELRYRFSDYTPISGVQDREDSKVQFSVRRTHSMGNGLSWTAMYSATANESTEAAYTYTSNVIQFGLRKRF